jgi:LysM repeat protein
VRAGDNLALIAERTGISLEELRALNPTLDPQGLVTGQRIRLRASGATGATGATGDVGATGSGGGE